jgi:hypothetical protein
MEFDRMNGNTKWRDAELLELAQLDEYKLLGVSEGAATPEGYTKINVHLYTITNDGRSRPDLWPETHDEHTNRQCILWSSISKGSENGHVLAELNGLELWATDVGNAFLESYTSERVLFKAGPEFGDREGHTRHRTRTVRFT